MGNIVSTRLPVRSRLSPTNDAFISGCARAIRCFVFPVRAGPGEETEEPCTVWLPSRAVARYAVCATLCPCAVCWSVCGGARVPLCVRARAAPPRRCVFCGSDEDSEVIFLYFFGVQKKKKKKKKKKK